MKNYSLFLILLLGLTGCIPTADEQEFPAPSQPPFVAQLPKLNRPDVILNELAKGDFHNGIITSIDLVIPASPPRQWLFEAVASTNKIHKMVLLNPYYTCEDTKFTFIYNKKKLIEEIISVRENSCLDFVNKWIYTYNYEEGLLVSITGRNYFTSAGIAGENYFVCDNYFSYYPNGKIATIYSTFRDVSQTGEYGFQKKSFIYDDKGNITEVKREEFHDSQYDEKYTFEYDESINPLKNIYIISSVQAALLGYGYASSLGPRFLSKNSVKSIKTEKLYNNRPPEFEYFGYTTFGNRVKDFGSVETTARGYRYVLSYSN